MGSFDSFDEVLNSETKRVYALCFRLTRNEAEAQDLCQETFVRALKAFHKFEGRSQISTWLYRIAMNIWKNKLRAKSRRPIFAFLGFGGASSSDEDISFDPKGPDKEPSEPMEKKESTQILQEALQSLPEESRQLIVLRDLEDKSYEDIGEILEVPLGTVKSRLARAREALRSKLVPILKAKGELS